MRGACVLLAFGLCYGALWGAVEKRGVGASGHRPPQAAPADAPPRCGCCDLVPHAGFRGPHQRFDRRGT